MHAGEQTQSQEQHRDNDPQDENGAANEAPPEASLWELATAIVILIRQTWFDRWALVKSEARLAAKSLVLIVLVSLLIAMTLVLIWGLALAVASYLAWQAGVHWGWIAAGLFVAQGLMLIYLRGQLRRLLRWLSFPETRRAFAPVPGAEKRPPEADSPS